MGEVDNSFRQDHSALEKTEEECQLDPREEWRYRKCSLVQKCSKGKYTDVSSFVFPVLLHTQIAVKESKSLSRPYKNDI